MTSGNRRPAVRHALAVAALAALAAACGTDAEVTTPTAPDPGTGTGEAPEGGEPPAEDAGEAEERIARAILDHVNDERRERGLTPFEWDDQLAELAAGWSATMADDGRLRHQDAQVMLDESDGFTAVGENLFHATGPAPASTIHVGWMRSDGHRANVLRPEFDRLGVGVVCEEGGAVWATQRFGRTAGGPREPVGDEVPPEEPIVVDEGEGPACPGGAADVEVELEGAIGS
jgi:uncharacterized protein YkwD